MTVTGYPAQFMGRLFVLLPLIMQVALGKV